MVTLCVERSSHCRFCGPRQGHCDRANHATLQVVVAQLECWKIGRTGAKLYLTVDLGASRATSPSKDAELRGVGPQGGVGRFQADTWFGHKPFPSQALATLMDMQCVF